MIRLKNAFRGARRVLTTFQAGHAEEFDLEIANDRDERVQVIVYHVIE